MIYWYTGQPGHGKTLHAIERLLEFKAQGRIVYACNIREFDYAKTGVLEMTPEQFKGWMEFLPDGAVALVDEAYEHGMLPKRPPGSQVPKHVEQLAKHRHRGLDFIFVSQSPDKQCDQFVHDLIERHVHVRRRFGTQFVALREFDRFEAQAEKATPISVRRGKLPKKVFGTYKSTELDTTERRIPWYYFAFGLGVPLALFLMYYTFGSMGSRLGNRELPPQVQGSVGAGNGATATVAAPAPPKEVTPEEYGQRFYPRIPSQPWSAPAYDQLTVPTTAPRVFCMSSGYNAESCGCLTEQGTKYHMPIEICRVIAKEGQYEPFYDEPETRLLDGVEMADENRRLISLDQQGVAIEAKHKMLAGSDPYEGASGDLRRP